MLCIGNIGDNLSAILDTIASGAVWMVERPGAKPDPGMWDQHIAGGKIDELHLGGKNPHRDRKQRGDHHVVEHRFDARCRSDGRPICACCSARRSTGQKTATRRYDRNAYGCRRGPIRPVCRPPSTRCPTAAARCRRQRPSGGSRSGPRRTRYCRRNGRCRAPGRRCCRAHPKIVPCNPDGPRSNLVLQSPQARIYRREPGKTLDESIAVTRHFENFFRGIALNPSLTGPELSGVIHSPRQESSPCRTPITKPRLPLS